MTRTAPSGVVSPLYDGSPISFSSTTYPKGLGVHAPRDIAFHLGGAAARFTSLAGIGNVSAKQSSVGATRAKVYGDDRLPRAGGRCQAASAAPRNPMLPVELSGVLELRAATR